MLSGQAALSLLSIFSVFQTITVSHQISLTEASCGDTVTLTCNLTGHTYEVFYWYKVNYGDMIQTVASSGLHRVTLEAEFYSPRFSVIKAGAVYCLTLRNVSKNDEATYVCQAGAENKLAFIDGTHLALKGPKNKKMTYVKQISEKKSVSLGTETTLECSFLSEENKAMDQCTPEHSVFWFKTASKSHPGMIHVARNICDAQTGRSCSYRLSKTMQNPSDTGTYHCAVVTCGEILFGEGTKVESGEEWDPVVIGLLVLLGLCTIVIACLIFSRH